MNKRLLLALCFCSSVHAESESLPPIIDNSKYYSGDYSSGVTGSANGGNATYSGKGAGSANAIYQVMGQMEQLQKELRQLSGTVEEQAHEIAELKKRQTTQFEDTDQRIQALETAKSVGTPAEASPNLSAADAPASSSIPVDASAATQLTPPVEPEASAAPVVALTPPVSAKSESGNQYPKEIYSEPKPATPPVPKAAEKEQYQNAYDTLRDGHYSRAIDAFNAQLSAYPNGEYAANAQYWLGEAYKVNQNLPAAKDAFNKVISQYPTSHKVPDALLKLGYIELEQDNLAKAREYLNKVSSQFPNTTAAHLAAKKLGALNGTP